MAGKKHQLSGALVTQSPCCDSWLCIKQFGWNPHNALPVWFWVNTGQRGNSQEVWNQKWSSGHWSLNIIKIRCGDRIYRDVGRFPLILPIFHCAAILSLLSMAAQDPPLKAWQQTHRGSCYTEAQLLQVLHNLLFHHPPGCLATHGFWLSVPPTAPWSCNSPHTVEALIPTLNSLSHNSQWFHFLWLTLD